MNTPLRSSRLVRRVILDENLPAGWPIKWGDKWDIQIGNEWKEFINKHRKL